MLSVPFFVPIFSPCRERWNLWLDDIRPTDFFLDPDVHQKYPEFGVYYANQWKPEDFIWAKSSDEAIKLVKEMGPPQVMALDHDLVAMIPR